MDQQQPATPPTPPTTPPPPPTSKKWTGKETLTVIFLVLIPIVGLILMWAIANWSKKVKIILTIVLLIIPAIALSSTVLFSLGGARETARDASRMADMRMIVTAQEMYYGMNDAYYTSASYPSRIGTYMRETPTDPKTEGPYGWIDNRSNIKKFCAYAELEKGGFYVATHGGNGTVTTEPRIMSDCEKFSGYWGY